MIDGSNHPAAPGHRAWLSVCLCQRWIGGGCDSYLVPSNFFQILILFGWSELVVSGSWFVVRVVRGGRSYRRRWSQAIPQS